MQHALAKLAEQTPHHWLPTRDIAAAVGVSHHDRRLAVALALSGWVRHWPRNGKHHPSAWAKPGVKTRHHQRVPALPP